MQRHEFPVSQPCSICGCTDERACPGGCYWYAPGVCTACAKKKGQMRRTKQKEPACKKEF